MEVEEISKVESQGELYGGHKFHEWLSKLLHLNHLEDSFQKRWKFLAIDLLSLKRTQGSNGFNLVLVIQIITHSIQVQIENGLWCRKLDSKGYNSSEQVVKKQVTSKHNTFNSKTRS